MPSSRFPRWPVRASGLAHFAPPLHRTRHDGLVYVRSVPPPVASVGKAMRSFRPPLRPAAPTAFPIATTIEVAIQMVMPSRAGAIRSCQRSFGCGCDQLSHSDHATRNGVTGACLSPSIVWLGRAVKVVHAAAYASRRGST